MQEKLQPLMKAGKIAEAEAEVDGVLKKLGMDVKPTAASATTDEASAEERMVARVHQIQKELPAWVKKTGKKEEANALMKTLKEQLAARNFVDAEKTADALLKMMGVAVAPAVAAERSANVHESGHNPEPFAAFIPQQLVFLASHRIALKPEQRDALLAQVKATQPRLAELSPTLENEAAALAALTSRERVDEAAFLARFEKFLNLEREAKLLQARQGVAILNLLTPEQQAKLRELKGNPDELAKLQEEFQKRITAKVERVQQGAEAWARKGRDPAPIAEQMEAKVRPLMDSGRVFEAEPEIDRVLEFIKKESE
jgi:Spy/CpxP family protein refolding chaperone